jgi:MYXO-CTERM domain-containing protein
MVLGLALVSSIASADLPPPDGRKYVDYGFRIENLSAFPQHVLLAFPCGTSSGAPQVEHVVVTDGTTVSVGRRGGSCELFAMKRADYEAWKATYKQSTDRFQDPELDKLFKSDRVVKCSAKPTPSFELDKSDPRSAVLETLRVEKIDDTTCTIKLPTAVASPTPASGPAATPEQTPRPTSGAPASRGCAGCTTGSESAPAPFGLALLALLVFRRKVATQTRSKRRHL